jgi:hypothetical protein
MSLIYRKFKNGDLKDWVVTVRRQGVIYRKYFKAHQEEEAKKYNEELLAKLPMIIRNGPRKGVVGRKVASKDPFRMSRCTLSIAEEGRCNLNILCSNYDKCLTETAKRDWPGFTNKKVKR